MASCSDNNRAKNWGGTVTLTLQPGQEFVSVTWKETSMWYVTRPMSADHKPTSYTFHEDSGAGMFEGTVIFKETK